MDKPLPVSSVKPPWVIQLESRLGWTEFDHDKAIAKDWPLVGLEFTTVIGSEHAWCGLACAIALKACGLVFPKGAAAASSWRNWAQSCEFICGAFLPIRHASGGAHITVFLYWEDEARKIAACLGGNQGDAYRISTYNLSGNAMGHDQVISGPRWPQGYPQSKYTYPRAKSDDGGSTR